MLGITVSDATLIGTLVLAFVAYFNGDKSGRVAAQTKEPGPVLSLGGGAFVDTIALHDNTAAIRDLADAIERARVTYEREDHDSIKDLMIQMLRRDREKP
jgi:hypothetical protein